MTTLITWSLHIIHWSQFYLFIGDNYLIVGTKRSSFDPFRPTSTTKKILISPHHHHLQRPTQITTIIHHHRLQIYHTHSTNNHTHASQIDPQNTTSTTQKAPPKIGHSIWVDRLNKGLPPIPQSITTTFILKSLVV